MREENSKIHAEEERKNEEAFAAFMQEQLDREAAQIEEELAKSPELAGLSPDDSAKEKLYEKIEAYERQQAYGRLSPEDQEALRLGRQIQREREEGKKAPKASASTPASSSAPPASPQWSRSWLPWGSRASAGRPG